jgi:energy-coupling factor transporter ATP-binding protein EcfA2
MNDSTLSSEHRLFEAADGLLPFPIPHGTPSHPNPSYKPNLNPQRIPAPVVLTEKMPHLHFDHLLGGEERNIGQYVLIGDTVPEGGDTDSIRLALNIDDPQCIAVIGSPGSGKSYLLGCIMEALSMPITNLNRLTQPVTTAIVHYARTEEYAPEWTAMTAPNSREEETKPLWERFEALPKGLPNQILLAPRGMREQRQLEYPHIPCYDLTFNSREINAQSWMILLDCVGKRDLYVQFLTAALGRNRSDVTVQKIRDEINGPHCYLSPEDRDKARMRLENAEAFIDDTKSLSDLVQPGINILLDMRDDYLHQDDAFAIIQVFMQVMASKKHEGRKFPKCILLDEAHNYGDSPSLWKGLLETIALMRHKRTSIIIASQNPKTIPHDVWDLCTIQVGAKIFAERWRNYIVEGNSCFSNVSTSHFRTLGKGQSWWWALKSTEERYTSEAVKVQVRTRATMHGGATIRASDDAK